MGMLVDPFRGRYTTTAKHFDGGVYYTASGTSLGSMPAGKKGTCSFFFTVSGGSGDRRILSADRFRLRLQDGAGNRPFELLGTNSSGSTLLGKTSNTTFGASGTQHHFAASWDLNSGTGLPVCEMFIDGVDDMAGGGTLLAGTISYDQAGSSWLFGGIGTWVGCLSEVVFHDDRLILANDIGKLRSVVDGRPMNLGPGASALFGTPVRFYSPTGDPTDNQGSEGAIFTLTAGALTACSSSPSD